MRVAIAPLAEAAIDIDIDSESVEIVTVYSRLPRDLEELRAVYPSARLSHKPRMLFLERSLWELIVAGALVAPPLSRIIDAPSFKPLEGLQSRIAASSFSLLRRLYRRGLLAKDDIARLLRAALEGLRDFSRVTRQVERLECDNDEAEGYIVGDDRLGAYYAALEPISRDEFLESHMLVIRSGMMEKRVRPIEYSAPQRPTRLEYALLVKGSSVEAGPYSRVKILRGERLEACSASIEVVDDSMLLELEGERIEVAEPETSIARRIFALYIDAFASAIISCSADSERMEHGLMVFEVVDGPVIQWGRVVTVPVLYNVYTSGLVLREPPLSRLLRSTLCLDAPRAGWLALAASSIYTSCCRVVVRVQAGGKTFVQRRDAPRVTA